MNNKFKAQSLNRKSYRKSYRNYSYDEQSLGGAMVV